MPDGLFCAIDNPLNDGTWTYTWQNGRQLARMQSIDADASFVYNENGLRVQKPVNGVVTKYILNGKHIAHMTRGNDELHFFYDASGKPVVVVYNGTPYSYVKNVQGDIVAILNSAGTVVVSYVYDVWGRPIATTGSMADTLGVLNPFRYRGYVFDEETYQYYLGGRYYSPSKCRFSNCDSVVGMKGHIGEVNTFAYCVNHPVTFMDTNGQSPTLVGKDGFVSADAAAVEALAVMYSICQYTRMELSTLIYSYTSDEGTLLYGYTDIVFGTPHACDPFEDAPYTPHSVVAYAHSHPNGYEFSGKDKGIAIGKDCHAYVVYPDGTLDKFANTFLKQAPGSPPVIRRPLPVGRVDHREFILSDETLELLRPRWDTHWWKEGCLNPQECIEATWPNEQLEYLRIGD